MKIYLVGSLRRDRVREVARALRHRGHTVFDDWHAAGPDADDIWRVYEQERGHNFRHALAGEHARSVFESDKRLIDHADVGVLVLPAGNCGHLELGYMVGRGTRSIILCDGEPDRWDVMYRFADRVCYTVAELLEELK